MNWYVKIIFAQVATAPAGIEGYLESIGATPEIIQYIRSQPGPMMQYLTNEFRKNPYLTLPNLYQIQIPQRIDPYTEQEKTTANRYPLEMQKWILVSFRKLRKGILPSEKKPFPLNIRELSEKNWLEYSQFSRKLDEIKDWFTYEDPDIASYTPEQAIIASDEWHRAAAGEGSGKIYEPTNSELIVYGPKWEKEKEWQGWTIQEVKSKNDLQVEGNKMRHCVGQYCWEVEKGNSKIFSLRDPSNNPHVTMETNSTGDTIIQIQGNSNRYPDNEYVRMVSEWFDYSKNSPEYYSTEEIPFEMGSGIEGIENSLLELVYGRGEMDNSFEYDFGLEANDTSLKDAQESFNVVEMLEEIFYNIDYELGRISYKPGGINWKGLPEVLIKATKELKPDQEKLLLQLLEEKLREEKTIYTQIENYILDWQKDFAKYVIDLLRKEEERKHQMEFEFAKNNFNWYKKAQTNREKQREDFLLRMKQDDNIPLFPRSLSY